MWSPSYSVVILGLLIAKLLSSASQHDQNYCSDRADGHLQPHHLVATLSKVNSDEMYEDQNLEQCSSETVRNVKNQIEAESLAASHHYYQDRRIDPVQMRENATVNYIDREDLET